MTKFNSSLSTQPLHYKGPLCVQFAYHMSDDGPEPGKMGRLSVDIVESSSRRTVWVANRDQGKEWLLATIDVYVAESEGVSIQ